MRQIEKSRFIRSAIETEVLRRAAAHCDSKGERQLNDAIGEQAAVIAKQDAEHFGELDYEFHEILCEIAQADYAFEVIFAEKTKVNRLCMLRLEKEQRMPELLADHRAIAKFIIAHDADAAVAADLKHLSRMPQLSELLRQMPIILTPSHLKLNRQSMMAGS